jgi:hypothetical protein
MSIINVFIMRLSILTQLSYYSVILVICGSSLANHGESHITTKQVQNNKEPQYQYNVVKGFPLFQKQWRNTFNKLMNNSALLGKSAKECDNVGLPAGARLARFEAQDARATAAEIKELIVYTSLIPEVTLSDNPKAWSKADLIKIANHKIGYAVVDALNNLRLFAGETDATGNYTQKAGQAQQVLAKLMPESPGKSLADKLLQFITNIEEVADVTKQKRDELRKSNELRIKKK